jgi:hypothetical protein
MKMILSLAIAASLSACATMAAAPQPVSSAAVAQVQARYDTAKRLAELFLPYLPAERRQQIEVIGALVDRALSAARLATTVAEQRAAIEEARAAADRFALVTGG